MYEIDITHEGLHEYKHITGTDKYIVEQKARAQLEKWDLKWEKVQDAERKRREREERILNKEMKIELANERTKAAQEAISLLENTLKHTLSIDDAIDWDSLKDCAPFPKEKPQEPIIPPEPERNDPKYRPELKFIDRVFSSRKKQKNLEVDLLFKEDHEAWVKKRETLLLEYTEDLKKWKHEKEEYELDQKENNQKIDAKKKEYLEKKPEAIYDYCEMVLSNSEYPNYFPQEFDLDYNPENKILICDYSLPSIDSINTLKEVKYIQSRDEFKEVHISDAAKKKLYDNLLYQIALRTIHELYEADVVDALDSIVFNGWVNSIDKATGKEVNACILTVQVGKEEFLDINLERIDPKLCFKSLKGVGSSKLHSLTPIAPLLTIDKTDRRFVSSYDVTDQLDDYYNLAAMDWEDFEHLIRELFEKEFSKSGGEVKVTQASRDGGVDAIAFDPDPIRGGKIVIQAKRYTNIVGVAAVRDLYGTVVNEGATKGILITTADFGADSYEFARGKPITLLNGSNLLHMLEKHGTKAKIDLREAKQILADKEK